MKEPILTGLSCDIVFNKELMADDFVCLNDISLKFENKKQNSKIGFTSFYGEPKSSNRNILEAHYYCADINSFPRMKSIDNPNVEKVNKIDATVVPGRIRRDIAVEKIKNLKLEFGDVSFVVKDKYLKGVKINGK